MDDLLDAAAREAGRAFVMTAEHVVAYMAVGDRRHGEASVEECGAVDPRDEEAWCRRPTAHGGGFHCRYRLDEDWLTPQAEA